MLGNSFRTNSDKLLEVKKFGELNPNAGPDFLGAEIIYDEALWAGSIEFHIRSSDWYVHKHESDIRYNNVIAHFVYEHDRDVSVNGVILPTVELKNKVNIEHFRQFLRLAESPKPIACASQLKELNPFVIYQQKERAMLGRLIRKSAQILADLKKYNGDFEKTFFLALARTLGGKVNSQALESLVENLDIHTLKKSAQNEFSVPSILFGVAGLLPENPVDHYTKELVREFEFQQCRLGLKQSAYSAFRFSRMHPSGFPTLRIAQFSEILKGSFSVSVFVDNNLSMDTVRSIFKIKLPEFWANRYRFENESAFHSAVISEELIDLILINTVVPFRFAIGQYLDHESLRSDSLDILTKIKPETNAIIRDWRKTGLKSINAFDSQALIEQKNEFCSKKKCLICTIGNHLLKS